MNQLTLLIKIAALQAGQGGRAVKTHQITDSLPFGRTWVHHGINELIMRNMIVRVCRGKYKLNDDNDDIRNIGLCVLLPMDVYEYKSRCEKLSDANAAA